MEGESVMEKWEIFIGKTALILMLAAVCLTGCGSGSYADTAGSVADYAADAVDMVRENAGSLYEEAAESAADIKGDFEEAAAYEAKSSAAEAPVEEEYVEGSDEAYDGGYGVSDSEEKEDEKKAEDSSGEVLLDAEKIVYHADISMSSRNFERARKQIRDAADKYGALIQSENYYEGDTGWYSRGEERTGKRNYYVELRVPSKNYDALVKETGNIDGVVNSVNTSAQNITRQYSDTKAEIESLEEEKKQLKSIMKDAKKVEDVLYIQDRITEIQTRINRDKSDISRMDTDIAYSYVNITLSEVMIYKEPEPEPDMTYEQKLMLNFYNSLVEFQEFCYDFVLYVVRNWIKILAWIIVIVIIVSVIRSGKGKREIRREVKRQYREKKKEERRLKREEKG